MKQLLKNYLLLSSYSAISLKKQGQIILALLFSFLYPLKAQIFQNLVPNGSFESYSQCPSNGSQIYLATPWTGPRINSTDYYNACSTLMNVPHYGGINHPYPYYLNAKDGVAYAGIYYYKPTENNREYAQVELLDTLKNGICYYVEFYVANSQRAPFGANNISANLSATWYNTTTVVINNSILNIAAHITNYGNPILKDTVKWENISGIYEATGIEKYLVIGNFASNAQTDTFRIYAHTSLANLAYIFIDAVSVYSINPSGTLPWSYRDTTINKGDTVFIGNKMGGLNFHPKWFNQNGTYIATNAGIAVSPTITTKYIVQYTLCGVQRTDTVKVTVPKEEDVALRKFQLINEGLKLFPNPAKDILQIQFTVEVENEFKTVSIYNNLGQLLREEELILKNKVAILKTNDLENGVYVLKLHGTNLQAVSKRFVINR